MNMNAIAATQFRQDRIDAGLPVATEDQVKRAQRTIEGNPMLRSHNTPLGIQLLAMKLSLTRRERQGLELKPLVIRFGDSREIEASPAAIAAYIEANPHLSAQEAASSIAQMHGYTTTEDILRITSRVRRFGEAFEPGKRFPSHIRQKMLCLSAMAQAIELCTKRDEAQAEAPAEAPGE